MKKKDKKNSGYDWQFTSIGGAARVKITSGEDIRHLGELDKKLWTVLSCPTNGLEFDQKSLNLMDTNGDGKIRTDEVIATASWLCSAIKSPDNLLKREDFIPLSEFNTETQTGAKLLASAKQILSNLGIEKDSISLAETSDNVKIFAGTLFNGDGIITPASAGGDEALSSLITDTVACIGGSTDRSGVEGATAESIEAFYGECADYKAWIDASLADKENIFPFGDGTEAAVGAVEAIADKVEDFFLRCKLIAFDEAALDALDVQVQKIGEISAGSLTAQEGEIATYPLARPDKEGVLNLEEGVNPSWQGAFNNLKSAVLDVLFPGEKTLDEGMWKAILAKLGPFKAWQGAKKGAKVEALGIDKVTSILAEDRKGALLDLIAKDKALEEEALSIESVDKLVRLYRDFYTFLNNYVSFIDFYGKKEKAVFQAGRLFIDQRSTDLCIKVEDMGKHADMAAQSGMYILYCACTSKVKGASMNIAAVLTNGDTGALKVGRNAVFYDRDGVDWDAVVTKIVDNPISLRQAFWAPYKKVGKWISDKFGKSVEEKNANSLAGLTAEADAATSAPVAGAAAPAKASSFDIAKFAGIFAAIGMAIAYLSTAIVSLAKGAAGLGVWKVILVLIGIMLVISGPSVIITWRKLRRRDVGPMLNANGWAINAASYVRQKFAASLTSMAKYPKLTAIDPEERKKATWKTIIWSLVAVIVLGLGFLYFTDRIPGHPFHKAKVENTEVSAEVPAEGETVPTAEIDG